MHIIGMLSFSLSIPLGYDLAVTGYPLVIAVLVSWFALYIVARQDLGVVRLLVGGVLLGLGIVSMHYVGRHALLMEPAIHFDPTIFAASIFIAIAASTVALWSARTLRSADQRYVMRKRIGTACSIGIAIADMHYTGMAATNSSDRSLCGAAGGLRSEWLAAAVIPSTFVVLIVTLLFHLDARAKFLASSVAQFNEQIDRMRGVTRRRMRPVASRPTRVRHAILPRLCGVFRSSGLAERVCVVSTLTTSLNRHTAVTRHMRPRIDSLRS